MSEAAMKRKLLEQANLLVKTNDPTTVLAAVAGLLDALGSLMSEWTGEVVRVRMTAEGQPEVLDMMKRPSVPASLLVAIADLVTQMEIVARVGFVDTPDDKDSCAAFCVAEGTWLELMSCAESLASSALAAATEANNE